MAVKVGPPKAGRTALCIRRNKIFEKKLLAVAFRTTNEMK
jgi:hypothetical protein